MKRIQIQLQNQKLEEVVGEMAEATVLRLSKLAREPKLSDEEQSRRVKTASAAIRSVLEKYVHSYDTCGLASVCQEAQETDPWAAKGQDED